jgi:membrane dipeptidase
VAQCGVQTLDEELVGMRNSRFASPKSSVTQIVACLLLLAGGARGADGDYAARIDRVLTRTPLIDGHNDLAWEIRERFNGDFQAIDLKSDTSKLPTRAGDAALMTDIPRLRAGHVGGQFWSVWVPPGLPGPEAVQMTVEQIDLVKRMAAQYPADLEMAYTVADILRIHRAGKIASLIGVEGGNQINNSVAVLRQFYALGARYLTLTNTSNTPWADSATDVPANHGITNAGVEIIHEMNRLGMLVDLSHVSPETMRAAIAASEAPIIFSHSSARALADHPRNVPDDVLRLVAEHDGIVMVNFLTFYLSADRNQWFAERFGEQAREQSPPHAGIYLGQPERAAAALASWDREHPKPVVTMQQVADHIEHIRKIAGIDHVGLGSDFDGMPDTPVGLEGVDRYPALLAELMRRGWSDSDIAKLAGENVLRVMAAAEHVGARIRGEPPRSHTTAN